MLTIHSVLALFTLLGVSSLIFFVAKKIKIPYTVLLVVIGLILVPISQMTPWLGFLSDLQLTPELLFFVFLPVLIFESAFNMNIRRMIENLWAISGLATIGLIISTALIAGGLYLVLPLVGIDIPLILALLFGAIISSTDPVAVLALFKEFGAPKRLTLIFEGESLFNDGTAVALFMVLLAIAQRGFNGSTTVMDGILTFIIMIIGGIILGLVVAFIFSRILRITRSNEFVSVIILIVSAHLTFIIGELINEHGLFGLGIHVSSIIATTIAALFLGNYSRHILSPKSDTYIEKSVAHVAFAVNSLVFILIGILFASSPVPFTLLWLPIVITIFIVATARIISVYSVILPLNKLKWEAPIPRQWQYLLSWGSLRGALAVIIVLLIPPEYTPAGWDYAFTAREFLLALTIGCILATLFVKALTIGGLIRKFKVNEESPLEKINAVDVGMYMLLTESYRFNEQHTKGFLQENHYLKIKSELDEKISQLLAQRDLLWQEYKEALFEQSLHLIAVDIERKYLKNLYVNDEVDESVYRKLIGKLTLQKEKIESADQHNINPSAYRDRKDIFDQMIAFTRQILNFDKKASPSEEQLMYYRAQSIIARKVLKVLTEMQTQYGQPVFFVEVFDTTTKVYARYQDQALVKMNRLIAENPETLSPLLLHLSERSLEASRQKSLEYLDEKGILKEHE